MGILQFGLFNRAALLVNELFTEPLSPTTIYLLVGIGVVLVVLILISLIIYSSTILPNLLDKRENKSKASNSSIDHVISQIVEQEEEELKDDEELVAVITAAIYASLQGAVPADGFIVRSIRRKVK